jgi:hydrogenase expression/formation protein HypD
MNQVNRNDPRFIQLLVGKIADQARSLGPLTLMHVCGTHEHTIVSSGLRSLLPKSVKLVSGPGCPVCITPKEDIERMIHLARSGLTVTTFGDMMRIPSDSGSLADAKAEGADVRIVYGIANALAIAREEDREVVHFGIGFETTVPTSSVALTSEPDNFSIYSVHRTIPEALDFLLSHSLAVDGFVDPGHVSTIIGSNAYTFISDTYGVPQVVAGFEPSDVLLAVLMLLEQRAEGRAEVENEYARGVRPEGNEKARALIDETFRKVDAKWRALPVIPRSGLAIAPRYREWDATHRHRDVLDTFSYTPREEDSACRCKDVLLGACSPQDCPLFRNVCTPDEPVGPCMVSVEGTCYISYKYG